MKTYLQSQLILIILCLSASILSAQRTILKTSPVTLALGIFHAEAEQVLSEQKSLNFTIMSGRLGRRPNYRFWSVETALRRYYSVKKINKAPNAPFIQAGIHYAQSRVVDKETLASATMIGGSLYGGRQWLFLKKRMSFGIGLGMQFNATVSKNVSDLRWRDVNFDTFRLMSILNFGIVLQ